MSTPNISAVTSQLVCDLKDHYPTKAHNITGKGLLRDPLGENIRICNACYLYRP